MGTPSRYSRIPRPISFSPPEFKNGTCTVRMLTRGPADGFRSYSVTGGSLAKAFTALLQEVPD